MGLLPMDASILPPSDDRIFKRILTEEVAKPALIDLLSAILGRPVKGVVIRNSEMTASDTEEKAERLDVNCRIDDDSQIDVEMQSSRIEEESAEDHQNLKGKGIYYLCDLHSSQPSKGIRRYDRLSKTYQVTFCMYPVFSHRAGYVHSFSLRNDADNELLSDAIHVIFVELSKLQEVMKKPVGEMTDLDKWAIFFRYAGEPKYRETVNKVIESKEALQMAGDVLMSISQDERERAVFRSRRMYQTDLESNLATAEDRGRHIGRNEGINEGINIGERNRNIAIAKKMLAIGEPIDKIMLVTDLTRHDIESLTYPLQNE